MSQIFANGQRQNINFLNNRLNFMDNIYTLPKKQLKRTFSKTLTPAPTDFPIPLLFCFSVPLKNHPINARLLRQQRDSKTQMSPIKVYAMHTTEKIANQPIHQHCRL